MLKSVYRATLMTIVLGVLTCGIYPAIVTAVGRIVFSNKARGGIVFNGQTPVGARLIAQNFARPEYVHPRPSAGGDKGYDAANSSGANLGPTNKKLYDKIAAELTRVRAENPTMGEQPVPTDLVTASASGLDPHISPEGAMYQAARVAAARHVGVDVVVALIGKHTEHPVLGFIGRPVVNVLELNLALDAVGKSH